MHFLRSLLYIKRPSFAALLDIALILSILPHLFVLKGFMLFYLLISLIFIFKYSGSKKHTAVLFVLGILSVVLSFFSSYNFSDFSRMQFFVSLISSLLILALTLQRSTNEINGYLKATPAMLFMLSFFFYDTLSMLFFSIFAFFVFVLLSIWSKMDAPLIEVVKFNSALFLLSLPMVVVLFIAFPRISFEKAEFGFRGDGYGIGSYDGKMEVGDAPFIGSQKVVMELYFEKQMPPESELYFRGSTLMPTAKYEWRNDLQHHSKEHLSNTVQLVEYNMVFYPTGKKWLYTLGIPLSIPKKTELQNDYTLQAKKEIYKEKRFRISSALDYRLTSRYLGNALKYDAKLYPKTYEAMHKIADLNLSQKQKAAKILAFFQAQKLFYTTRPKKLNNENVVDSFLFDAKNGYCTHFASAFAIAARIAGIPSRVVSGYKADYTDRIKNYLVVKQKDAHAWVELYLPKQGWVRYDPTATAYKSLDAPKKSKYKTWFEKLNNQYMYIKYIISDWVLGFDRLKQLAILDALLNNTLYLIKFIGSIVLIGVISVVLFYLLLRSRPKDKLTKQVDKLLNILAKKGLVKQQNETMEVFLNRAQKELGISLQSINNHYHRLKYSRQEQEDKELDAAIDAFRDALGKKRQNSHDLNKINTLIKG